MLTSRYRITEWHHWCHIKFLFLPHSSLLTYAEGPRSINQNPSWYLISISPSLLLQLHLRFRLSSLCQTDTIISQLVSIFLVCPLQHFCPSLGSPEADLDTRIQGLVVHLGGKPRKHQQGSAFNPQGVRI